MLTKYDLYELCVQSPTHLVPLLRAIHGGAPTVLAEDFAGTGALSRHWIETVKDGRAIATDHDSETLARAGSHDRLVTHAADVLAVTDPADVLFVGNFSIGYFHTRPELVAYLKHVRTRLDREAVPRDSSPWASHGAFICDTYGGESTFTLGHVHRYHPLPDGSRVRYTWEQREADPLTGMVTDVIHFRIERSGHVLEEIDDAFVYRWRLWSVPELRDAMLEAGFARTAVFAQLADAIDDEGNAYVQPVEDPDELEDSFIVCVAGFA